MQKSFTMNDKELSNFIMVILEWYLRLNTNQFKTLTPKQIIWRLPIAIAQAESGNTLLNGIRKIIDQ